MYNSILEEEIDALLAAIARGEISKGTTTAAADLLKLSATKIRELKEFQYKQAQLGVEDMREITALREATRWHPIDTAPMDGTDVLVCWPSQGDEQDVLSWQGSAWTDDDGNDYLEPEYWRALPALPEKVANHDQ